MIKIIAIKDNKFIHGKVSEVANAIGCTARNLRDHHSQGKKLITVNEFIVYLEGDSLDGNRNK